MAFEKWQSGNKNGRPRGSSRADKLRLAIENDIPAIIEAVVVQTKSGDTSAAKLLLDRVVPTIKPLAQTPAVGDLSGLTLTEQAATIFLTMGKGEISPEQAQQMLAGLVSLSKVREMDDLIKRVELLESQEDAH